MPAGGIRPPHTRAKNLYFPDGNSEPLSGAMPVEVNGRLIDDMTIQLDQPLKSGEERVVVRLRKHPKKKTKLHAPEEYILKLAEKDLEELY